MFHRRLPTRLSRLLPAALLAATGAALANPWTTIGSAGVVDEADTGLVEFVNGEARMRADAPIGAVLNLRYNVVSLAGFAGLNEVVWINRFRDNGAGARVRLTLRQYNLNGTTSTLATFDSNAWPANASYQTQRQCVGVDWDFINGPFYIEAELTKVAADGTPALGISILSNEACTP